ncbi:hypothetical protein ON010_g9183 [Phytophthora cinnamomi]|nr:hypothetical protein ON010_g9183 [Phytophthora cinnamomi]
MRGADRASPRALSGDTSAATDFSQPYLSSVGPVVLLNAVSHSRRCGRSLQWLRALRRDLALKRHCNWNVVPQLGALLAIAASMAHVPDMIFVDRTCPALAL